MRTRAVPSVCQNGARTGNTEHERGTRQTGTDQGNGSWLPTMRQPEKRKVGSTGVLSQLSHRLVVPTQDLAAAIGQRTDPDLHIWTLAD